MDVQHLLQIRAIKSRRIIEVFLVVFGTIYFALLMVMYSISPLTAQIHAFFIFAVVIATSLIGIHFIKRLNWLLVLAAVTLPAQPFFGNMFLFLDWLSRQTINMSFLKKSLDYCQGYSFVLATVCMLLFIVGLVGGVGACFREYRTNRQKETGGQEL